MSAPIGGDLSGYYRMHAPIYDLTRPFFLFGRRAMVRRLAQYWRIHGDQTRAPRVLEIGCGTGSNLALLQKQLPGAQLVGLDLAPAMLDRARTRLGTQVQLLHGALGEVPLGEPFDLVLASLHAQHDWRRTTRLRALGAGRAGAGWGVGVVDFERSGSTGFARWMQRNHVRMDGLLTTTLAQSGAPPALPAHAGVWRRVDLCAMAG